MRNSLFSFVSAIACLVSFDYSHCMKKTKTEVDQLTRLEENTCKLAIASRNLWNIAKKEVVEKNGKMNCIAASLALLCTSSRILMLKDLNSDKGTLCNIHYNLSDFISKNNLPMSDFIQNSLSIGNEILGKVEQFVASYDGYKLEKPLGEEFCHENLEKIKKLLEANKKKSPIVDKILELM